MREPFLQKLEKRAVVCDGAMGTMLYSKGISLNRCFEELNVSLPQLVKEVHLGYVKAGAEVIETNTFGRSEEHTSELQSPCNLVCRLLLEKKKNKRVKQNES